MVNWWVTYDALPKNLFKLKKINSNTSTRAITNFNPKIDTLLVGYKQVRSFCCSDVPIFNIYEII